MKSEDTIIKTPEELTEDWRKGKIEPNYYYVKYIDGDEGLEFAGKWYDRQDCVIRIGFEDDDIIKEILGVVPDYKENQRLIKVEEHTWDYDLQAERISELLVENMKIKTELTEHRESCCCLENEKLRLDKAKLEEENKQLRDLLKECEANFINRKQELQKLDELEKPTKDLLTRIKDALGGSWE